MNITEWRPAAELSLEHLAETLLAEVPLVPAGWQESSVALRAALVDAGLTREQLLARRWAHVKTQPSVSADNSIWPACSPWVRDWLQLHQPQWRDELAWRMRPLREQWEMRGAGFTRAWLRRFAEPPRGDLPKSQLTIDVVIPCRGGYGALCDASPTLMIEGLLTDVDPRLPELARLAWLVSMGLIASVATPLRELNDNRVSWLQGNYQTLALRGLLSMATVIAELEWFPIDSSFILRAASRWGVASSRLSEVGCHDALERLLQSNAADAHEVLACAEQLGH